MNHDSIRHTKFPLVQRIEYLTDLCRGKKVLHLGCTDWPFTQAAIESKTHLHFYLSQIAGELYGFDYDLQGLESLAAHNFQNLYRADLEKLEEVALDKRFDVIVAGEIIEHLSNPGLFLRGVQRFMSAETNLVVTTINAYCAMRMLRYGYSGRGGSNEPVHPDHVAYYSYSTLQLLVQRANLVVDKFAFYDIGTLHRAHTNWKQRFANDVFVRLSRQFADGIIAECSLATDKVHV